MKPELYYCKHTSCKTCTETTSQAFKYIKAKKNEKRIFEMVNNCTVIFIMSGEAMISCNELVNGHYRKGDIVLCPENSNCVWETLNDIESIILTGKPELPPCDEKALKESAELWLNAIPTSLALPIKPRMTGFLESVKQYLKDDVMCPYMYKSKLLELSMIFRAYYSPEELVSFFFPAIRCTHQFESFVMNNYLRMKGVKEFVDLSGMNLSTFNRKFKAHFKESPYQWLIKQKSKHIYYELTTTDKSISAISKDFQFADASHFNRYCKSMFGASPTKIRENLLSNPKPA